MSFDIEILEEKKNPLIDRVEIKFKVNHLGKGTPNRMEIKKKLSSMMKLDEKNTIIKKIQTYYGSMQDIGKAFLYNNLEDLKYFEPFHIQVRNLQKEKRIEIYKLKRKKEPYKHIFDY